MKPRHCFASKSPLHGIFGSVARLHAATAKLRQEHCIRRLRKNRQDGLLPWQVSFSLFTMAAMVLKLAASGTTRSRRRRNASLKVSPPLLWVTGIAEPRTQSRFARFEDPDSCELFAEACSLLPLEQFQVKVLSLRGKDSMRNDQGAEELCDRHVQQGTTLRHQRFRVAQSPRLVDLRLCCMLCNAIM